MYWHHSWHNNGLRRLTTGLWGKKSQSDLGEGMFGMLVQCTKNSYAVLTVEALCVLSCFTWFLQLAFIILFSVLLTFSLFIFDFLWEIFRSCFWRGLQNLLPESSILRLTDSLQSTDSHQSVCQSTDSQQSVINFVFRGPLGRENTCLEFLRAHDCKYRESLARLKKSKILIICQKNPFGELSSKKIFLTFKNL